jgi:hypothetical protein
MSITKRSLKKAPADTLNLGVIGITLMIWGGLGFLFAFYFSAIEQNDSYEVTPVPKIETLLKTTRQADRPAYQVGPIVVENPGEVFEVIVRANLPDNHWSFIEVELLDNNEEYLYSFGQELWRESGRDSDGNWSESKRDFDTKLTFPVTGYYYLNFIIESKNSRHPKSLDVKVIKRRGSDIPHFWAAVLSLVIGLILVEIKYGIFQKTIEALNHEEDK